MQRSAASVAARGGACRQLARPPGGSGGRRQRAARRPPQAGLFDDLLNFESWAPRSSQAWRLGNNPNRREEKGGEGKIQEEDVDVLNQRLAEARQGGAAAPADAAPAAAAEDAEAAQPSFLQSTDEQVASALAGRIAEVASGGGGGGGVGGALTGPLLRDLVYGKWGKAYDLSFVRRDLPLGKTLICLNVMWTHLEQRSFPMSEEEYDEKLELMALYLK